MSDSPTPTRPSVNALAQPLLQRLIDQAGALGVTVSHDAAGVRTVDAGIAARGSVAAGVCIGEICMGGLGQVALRSGGPEGWPTWLEVHSAQPVLACLGSQYAGWSLAASKEETGGKKFFALVSGPARALAGKEALFDELGYRDRADCGVLVMEVDRAPPLVVVDKVLRDCGLAAAGLTLVLTPTRSLAGTTQVVARVLEVALHKAHELGFALHDVVAGSASAPLPASARAGPEPSAKNFFSPVSSLLAARLQPAYWLPRQASTGCALCTCSQVGQPSWPPACSRTRPRPPMQISPISSPACTLPREDRPASTWQTPRASTRTPTDKASARARRRSTSGRARVFTLRLMRPFPVMSTRRRTGHAAAPAWPPRCRHGC